MMKKIFLATTMVTIATASLIGCGKANESASAISSNAHSTTLSVGELSSSENLAPPVEGKKSTDILSNNEPETKQGKKELVVVDEQAILKGYDQTPVLFDSYGVWIDEDGEKVSGPDAAAVFSEQPEWATEVISFNRELAELDTPPRKTLLVTYVNDVAESSVSSNTENAPYIRNRLEGLVAQWKLDKSFLGFIDPTAEGAYDIYNEVLGFNPESVPLCQDASGRWFDQNDNIMADEAAEAWFAKYPDCAELMRAFSKKAQDSDMLLYASELLRTTFRQGYVLNICSLTKSISPKGVDEYLARGGDSRHTWCRQEVLSVLSTNLTRGSDNRYIWWEKELTNLQGMELPEFVAEPELTP